MHQIGEGRIDFSDIIADGHGDILNGIDSIEGGLNPRLNGLGLAIDTRLRSFLVDQCEQLGLSSPFLRQLCQQTISAVEINGKRMFAGLGAHLLKTGPRLRDRRMGVVFTEQNRSQATDQGSRAGDDFENVTVGDRQAFGSSYEPIVRNAIRQCQSAEDARDGNHQRHDDEDQFRN